MIQNGCLGGKKSNTHKWCERWGPLHCKVYRLGVYSSDGGEQFSFWFQSPSEDRLQAIFTFTTDSHKADPTEKNYQDAFAGIKEFRGRGQRNNKAFSWEEKKMCLHRGALGHWRQSSVKSFIVVHGVRGYLEASVCSEWAFTCLSAPLEQAEYLEGRTANALRTETTSCACLPVFLSASVWRHFELPAVILDHRWLETLH